MYTLMHKYIQCRHKHYTTKYKLKVRINLVFSSQNSEQYVSVWLHTTDKTTVKLRIKEEI